LHIYELSTEIRVPGRVKDIFPFFADAANLEKLTPPWLKFDITTPRPIEMRVGALIDYRIWLRIVPMRWRTKITVWDPPHRFVDEQLKGPYRQWIHEHTFSQDGDEVVVRDHVRYAVPGGPLIERAVHALLVKPDIDRIFAYRVEAMRKLL
jgi:ligand-binding SRPBCC domain-containing protein